MGASGWHWAGSEASCGQRAEGQLSQWLEGRLLGFDTS